MKNTNVHFPTRLWCDLGGRVSCTEHLGTYATSALQENPRATVIETPITVWRPLPKEEHSEPWGRCETCEDKR